MHRIPNASPGLIFGRAYIWKDIWVSLLGAYFGGAYIWDFTVYYYIDLSINDFHFLFSTLLISPNIRFQTIDNI